VITGAIGVAIALSQLGQPRGLGWQVVSAILGIPLIVGVASFLRLLTLDFYFRFHLLRWATGCWWP
jgi:hypothetical protein